MVVQRAAISMASIRYYFLILHFNTQKCLVDRKIKQNTKLCTDHLALIKFMLTKTTIPVTRPVNGADLDQLRERLGLSTADACWLYGLPMPKWANIVKKKSNEPLKKAT